MWVSAVWISMSTLITSWSLCCARKISLKRSTVSIGCWTLFQRSTLSSFGLSDHKSECSWMVEIRKTKTKQMTWGEPASMIRRILLCLRLDNKMSRLEFSHNRRDYAAHTLIFKLLCAINNLRFCWGQVFHSHSSSHQIWFHVLTQTSF